MSKVVVAGKYVLHDDGTYSFKEPKKDVTKRWLQLCDQKDAKKCVLIRLRERQSDLWGPEVQPNLPSADEKKAMMEIANKHGIKAGDFHFYEEINQDLLSTAGLVKESDKILEATNEFLIETGKKIPEEKKIPAPRTRKDEDLVIMMRDMDDKEPIIARDRTVPYYKP